MALGNPATILAEGRGWAGKGRMSGHGPSRHPPLPPSTTASGCQPREHVSSSCGVLMAAEPLTELEAAIETVVTTFFTFAGREGRKGSLSVNEFKELVTQQLPHLLKFSQVCWERLCQGPPRKPIPCVLAIPLIYQASDPAGRMRRMWAP
ncbi:protein S100-A13 isoform X1 [Cervus elaphus]|uniref:protein S100-A13 isoform X1 n=1 Tax=Cervus canadensis TaxID=1574408 RepID=UPI001C9E4711|nr:protein S100-A13 isoform X1 [Cervus canadensis]XP_043731684.1 protein S100-A13 isoform X1 [Cervus elaphus]